MRKRPLVLSIDFDGTIVEEKFPDVGKIIPEAKKYINKLYDDGHHIVINTCRSGRYEGNAEAFLKRRGIKYHYINANMPFLIEQYGQDCRKISADIYIDDRCLMGLPSWKEIYEIVQTKYENIL